MKNRLGLVSQVALALLFASMTTAPLSAQTVAGNRTRVALFDLAGSSQDPAVQAVLSTMAQSIELSLIVLDRYEVRRVQPPADPETDMARVRSFCESNRMDQAVLGSGSEKSDGGFTFRLLVYDRRTDSIVIDRHGSSSGALDMFDAADTLMASLLDGLSGTHLAYASLRVDTIPPGATILVNGREIGHGPLSVRGVPTGTLEISAHANGYEDARASVTLADGEKAVAALTLARSMGKLSIQVPAGTQVTIATNVPVETVTGPSTVDLPTGDYVLTAAGPGLAGTSEKVTVERNSTVAWAPQLGLPVQAPPLPAHGPPDLYSSYVSEYEGLAALTTSSATGDRQVEQAKSLKLRALAQPYQDFQDLAGRTGELVELLQRRAEHNILAAQRKAAQGRYENAATVKALGPFGWISLLVGTPTAIVGIYFAVQTTHTAGSEYYKDRDIATVTGLVGGILDGFGLCVIAINATQPDPRRLKETVEALDRQISELGISN